MLAYKNLAARGALLWGLLVFSTFALSAHAETIRQSIGTDSAYATTTVGIEFVAPYNGSIYTATMQAEGLFGDVYAGSGGTGVSLCGIDGSGFPLSCHYAANTPQHITAKGLYPFDFSANPLAIVAGTHYVFLFDFVSTTNHGASPIANYFGSFTSQPVYVGSSGATTTAICFIDGSSFRYCPGGIEIPYFVLTTTPLNIDISTLYPASTSTLVSLTAAQSFCGSETFATSTGFLGTVAQDFSRGICLSFAFLFVPNASSIGQWTQLSDSLQSKIPFSYVYGIQGIFGRLQASSTANLSAVTFNLPAIGSSSPIGTLYPTTIVGLSTTTIGTYLSESFRQGMLGLQVVALWVGLAYAFYRRIIPHHVMTTTT